MEQEFLSEGTTIEYKKAQDGVPKSFWETYSSFSNTEGGTIYLGVSEEKDGCVVTGVKDANQYIQTIVDTAHDEKFTNFNNIYDSNIEVLKKDELTYIKIYIPEVKSENKPLHVKNNINNSYIRRNDSDHKMNIEEIRRFLRDADPKSDSELLPNFTIDDLDLNAIRKYKSLIQERNYDMDILSMDNWEFLKQYGAVGKDRNENKFKLKKGALLFFGKENAILDVFPNFHLDYRNRTYYSEDERWVDRVASGEGGNEEINLFNFYNTVLDKLVNTVLDGFALDKKTQVRQGVKTDVEVSLREALANLLIHADYEDNSSIIVEAYKNNYVFINPGELLVTKEEFARGGESKPRNSTIVTLFRKAGYSERAGSGGMKIFSVAYKNKFRTPEIQSSEGKTKLKIWKIDLVDSYENLGKEEKIILQYIVKENRNVKMKEIQALEGFTEYLAKTNVNSLIDKGIVKRFGESRSTAYGLKPNSSEMIANIEHNMRNMQESIINENR
ncbi:ATP-dependent DNA helicase RecG [Staphylococcus hominis]|uniref:RNA-binding domain-containing protein n=1 Tax=Staphylococcus hominis TaxID=1290 RepID=UPI000E69C831|nr:RNA-binding domain-containing protein [Staphylococcus hominis]RIO54540.1 ATP-dependent DNA helicase RecG [Staphylococcus hominis]